jgi:hypothetical protein
MSALSSTHVHAIELLILGRPVTEVAERVGVHRSTLHRWMKYLPEFIALLNSRRQEVWSNTADMLRAAYQRTLIEIQKFLVHPNPFFRFQAIGFTLRLAGKKFIQPVGATETDDVLNDMIRMQKQQAGLRDWNQAPWPEERESMRADLNEKLNAPAEPVPPATHPRVDATPEESASQETNRTCTPEEALDAARRTKLDRAVEQVSNALLIGGIEPPADLREHLAVHLGM